MSHQALRAGNLKNTKTNWKRMMPSPSALKLLDLIQSHRVTAVIYVAAKLGVGELLRDGPRSLDEWAKATGADKQASGVCSPHFRQSASARWPVKTVTHQFEEITCQEADAITNAHAPQMNVRGFLAPWRIQNGGLKMRKFLRDRTDEFA